MPAIEDIYNFTKRLKIEDLNKKKQIKKFDKKINITNLKFDYKNKNGNQPIFQNLNLKINKSEKNFHYWK